MSELKTQSTHEVGDDVILSFPPSEVKHAKIEAVKFTRSTVYYDVSIKMFHPKWDKVAFTRLNDVHSGFVLKEEDI